MRVIQCNSQVFVPLVQTIEAFQGVPRLVQDSLDEIYYRTSVLRIIDGGSLT